MAVGLRIDRVEQAPWKRLEMLLASMRRGEAWPPVHEEVRSCVEAALAGGYARLAVGLEGEEPRPVSSDDLAEAFEALAEAVAEAPVPVAVTVEMFRAGASGGRPSAASSEEEDEVEEVPQVAIFTLKVRAAA